MAAPIDTTPLPPGPDLDKPAKAMLRILSDLSRGRKSARYTGLLGGMSVNKRWMLAATNYMVESTDPHRDQVLSLFDNMSRTGHMALSNLETGAVSSEAGTIGMHWSFSVGSVLALMKEACVLEDNELYRRCVSVIQDEIALCSAFTYQGSVYIPAPRVKGKPWDGYRDLFTSMALTGFVPRRKEQFWARPESVVVSLVKWMIQTDMWSADVQAKAAKADLPKLYLPISTRVLDGGGWIASIARDQWSIPQSKLEGLCDWVRCKDGDVTWGNDWKKPVPGS